ncbi:hypothetical protein BOW53_03080 [Solemya pervernicosa gill symbiont]|uniref:Uncharacterized protein n=2 Tax=Solemya pervernicosa gill symbiont TaxID=642797 RepID=A0A1T2L9R9_9GAMM|nr:hypothetical protein BOW53_03080 [Solemya pervernicosa gill symbiont]
MAAAGLGGDDAPTLDFRAAYTDTGNSSGYTFSAADIGTASATRRVVVTVAADDKSMGDISGVTIGGSAATQVVKTSTPTGTNKPTVSIWELDVASGATADIVATFTDSKNRCAISVYALDNLATGSVSNTTDQESDPISVTLNVEAGDIVIAAAAAGVDQSYSWTGATEDYDTALEGTSCFSGASEVMASTDASYSVSASLGGAGNHERLAVAVWR